jgi:hypothetical protein
LNPSQNSLPERRLNCSCSAGRIGKPIGKRTLDLRALRREFRRLRKRPSRADSFVRFGDPDRHETRGRSIRLGDVTSLQERSWCNVRPSLVPNSLLDVMGLDLVNFESLLLPVPDSPFGVPPIGSNYILRSHFPRNAPTKPRSSVGPDST